MFKFTYNFFIVPLVYSFLLFISLFHKKINRFIKVRKKLFLNLEKQKIRLNPYKKTILFHCSSLGEYKQIIPLINKFREVPDQYNIILTLYSPSAGDNLKELPLVEVLAYLPLDTMIQMKKFINIIKPDLVVISKHDLWPNFLFEIKRNKIPVYLVNALLPETSYFLKSFICPFIKPYFSLLDGIIAVNEEHKERFKKIVKSNVKLLAFGDSRFDTVKYEAKLFQQREGHRFIETHKRNFVAGSSWSAGEKIIIQSWHKIKYCVRDSFLIIVPHEITPDHIYKIEFYCQENNLSSVVYSEYLESTSMEIDIYDVVIVDKIGVLVEIYESAYISYVGGGFGKAGLHSVLEPAAYGLPVLFGPDLSKSPEAKVMQQKGCGISFNDVDEFTNEVLSLYQDKDYYQSLCSKSLEFIEENSGVTDSIYDVLAEELQDVEVVVSESFTNAELEKMLNEFNSDNKS